MYVCVFNRYVNCLVSQNSHLFPFFLSNSPDVTISYGDVIFQPCSNGIFFNCIISGLFFFKKKVKLCRWRKSTGVFFPNRSQRAWGLLPILFSQVPKEEVKKRSSAGAMIGGKRPRSLTTFLTTGEIRRW